MLRCGLVAVAQLVGRRGSKRRLCASLSLLSSPHRSPLAAVSGTRPRWLAVSAAPRASDGDDGDGDDGEEPGLPDRGAALIDSFTEDELEEERKAWDDMEGEGEGQREGRRTDDEPNYSAAEEQYRTEHYYGGYEHYEKHEVDWSTPRNFKKGKTARQLIKNAHHILKRLRRKGASPEELANAKANLTWELCYYINTDAMEVNLVQDVLDAREPEDATEMEEWVLETKYTTNMTSGGKRRTGSALVIVGNFNGLVGYAVGKGPDIKAAEEKALKRAYNNLIYIPRCENRTIFEPKLIKLRQTRMYLRPNKPGTGLRAHHFVQALCHIAGIKDINVKMYGSNNPMNIIQAAIKGLTEQRDPLEVAWAQGKSMLKFTHPDQPPEVVFRHPNPTRTPPSKAQVSKATQDWLIDFPGELTFDRAKMVRHLIEDINNPLLEEACDPDLLAWVTSMPAEASLASTVFANPILAEP